MRVVLFLGAGFSSVAGLPYGDALFDVAPPTHSNRSAFDVEETLAAWRKWRRENPESATEEFVSCASQGRTMHQQRIWSSLVRFLAHRLAVPFSTFYTYDGRTSRSRDNIYEAAVCPEHRQWWEAVLAAYGENMDLRIVTTNWDILIERALRPMPTSRPRRPGFHYGSGDEILAATTAHPMSKWRREPWVRGNVPLLKLHGSLNWALERGALVRYGDLRPAFRGDAAIVPPVKHKAVPEWAAGLWRQAQEALMSAGIVMLVGYSLPEYDEQVRCLLREGLKASGAPVHVFDPNAGVVCERMTGIAPKSVVYAHPGLPQGTPDVHRLLTDICPV